MISGAGKASFSTLDGFVFSFFWLLRYYRCGSRYCKGLNPFKIKED